MVSAAISCVVCVLSVAPCFACSASRLVLLACVRVLALHDFALLTYGSDVRVCAGNLDMVYSANGQLTQVTLGRSVSQNFDATAVENQKANLGQLPLSNGATITNTDVVVGPPTYSPTGSECRNPGDAYYPVQTTLMIDFPIVTCYSPECIILDPIKLVS